MDLGLQQQTAVVLGGASGIGRSMADVLAQEGCRVAIVDRSADAAQRTALSIQTERGVTCVAIVADVSDEQAVQSAQQEIERQLGPVDHVLFAAAVGSGKFGFPFLNVAPADWPRVFQVGLFGAVHAAHAFAPRMIERRKGSFLFISSVAGQIGSQTDPPYSASKAALLNFMQCVAKDLAPHGVRANAICPGMVQTPLNQAVWQAWHDRAPESERLSYDAWAAEKIRRTVPLNRWQTAEEIAALAVFLASDHARNVTGQTLNVDGGQVMRF